MSPRIRFREDGIAAAEWHAAELRGEPRVTCPCDDLECHLRPENYRKVPPAEPGDCWRLTWHGSDAVSGYAICCPRCRLVHYWCSANNCGSKRPLPGGGATCDHAGKASCWEWTGSAEAGTLTARPSLLATAPLLCGWHGWLTNGELTEC